MDVTAVVALRRARRRNRIAAVDPFDAFYRTYLIVLLSVIAVGVASDIVGGTEASPAAIADVTRRGPAALGLVAAAGVFLGVRSGARGGPLGIEQGDIRHLFLAPVPRAAVVLPLVFKQARATLTGATAFGAACGLLANRRLPGDTPGWITAGAAFGAAVALLTLGTAYLASGRRATRLLATALGAVALAWAAADFYSPFTALGRVALAPLQAVDPAAAVVAAVVTLATAAAGFALAPGLSLEAAEHRSKLVGELRFAATLQDIRTVLVLQRQLAQDRPRRRPWVPLSARRRVRFPVWRRDWHGLVRWRASRYLRLGLLGAAAGAAVVAADEGTPAFLALAAAAFWLAGLDVAEPIAQEMDHPTLLDSYPHRTGRTVAAHLPASMTAMCGPAVLAVGVATPSTDPAVTVAATVAAAVTAVVGATVTLVKGPPPPFDPVDFMIGPEAAAFRKIQRLLFPVVVAGAGVATTYRPDPVIALASVATAVVAVALLLVWLSFQ